jgi:hypothetical protein
MADIDQNLRAALRTVAEDGSQTSRHGHESGAAVRRISERRQTRQRAFAATAIVVVAALVGGGILLNRPSAKTVLPGGPSSTPTPTSPAPTVTAQSMLTATDLADSMIALSNPYPGTVAADGRSTPEWACAPAPTPGAPAQTAAFKTLNADGTWIDQRVESFEDATAAAAAMDAITHRFTSCASSTSGVTLDQNATETGVGDAAVVLTDTLPSAADAHAVHSVLLEVARTGRVVTWVGLEFYTQDSWPAQDIALRRAVSKLCSLGGGACVTEPVARTTTFDASWPQVDPSSLTPELLGTSLGGTWTPTVDETVEPPYGCSIFSDSTGPNTPGLVVRAWATDLVDSYAAEIVRSNVEAGEAIRPYATAQAASDAVNGLASAFDSCTSPATQRVGNALVWKQGDGRTWFAFGTKGSHVVTLEVRANGQATRVTASQVSALLDATLGQLS